MNQVENSGPGTQVCDSRHDRWLFRALLMTHFTIRAQATLQHLHFVPSCMLCACMLLSRGNSLRSWLQDSLGESKWMNFNDQLLTYTHRICKDVSPAHSFGTGDMSVRVDPFYAGDWVLPGRLILGESIPLIIKPVVSLTDGVSSLSAL